MTSRDPYVVGRLASYWVPTVGHVDAELMLLSVRLASAHGREAERLQHDIDQLLDRRSSMAPVKEAAS